jgi:hypothetical protein
VLSVTFTVDIGLLLDPDPVRTLWTRPAWVMVGGGARQSGVHQRVRQRHQPRVPRPDQGHLDAPVRPNRAERRAIGARLPQDAFRHVLRPLRRRPVALEIDRQHAILADHQTVDPSRHAEAAQDGNIRAQFDLGQRGRIENFRQLRRRHDPRGFVQDRVEIVATRQQQRGEVRPIHPRTRRERVQQQMDRVAPRFGEVFALRAISTRQRMGAAETGR